MMSYVVIEDECYPQTFTLSDPHFHFVLDFGLPPKYLQN